MYTLSLLIISILPVIIIGKYIYTKDKEKEPKKLLIRLFLGGILSTLLVIIITMIIKFIFPSYNINVQEVNSIQLLLNVFLGIALVEEFSKWIVTYKISYNHIEFNEFYDIIIYATFVSLGFSCIENILYVIEGGIATGILRAFLSVPGHACNGVFMGYYLGIAKISQKNNRNDLYKKNLYSSLIIPTILHGIFDYCLISNKIILLLIFFIFIFILYKNTLKKIKRISSLQTKIKYKDTNCPTCNTPVKSNYCPTCGRRNN